MITYEELDILEKAKYETMMDNGYSKEFILKLFS